jgi:hypothetical protein
VDGAHITIKQKKNWEVDWEVRAVPRLCELYLGICLTPEEKARKNLSWGSRKVPRYPGGICPVHIHTNNTQNNTMTQTATYITIRILKLTKNT